MPEEKKETELSTVVSKLITYSVLSAPMGYLIAEDGFRNRAQLNVLIVSSFGSGKSSAFDKLEDLGLGYIVQDYTAPAVLGSIRPGGKIIRSVLIHAANRAFIIDEFQKFPTKVRNALLNFMEKHWYRRPLGFKVDEKVEEKGDGWEIIAEGNVLQTYVKCSYICGAMYFKKKTTDEEALLSRCFPVVLTMTKEEAYELFMGYERIKIDSKLVRLVEHLKGIDIFVSNKMKALLVKEFDEATKGLEVNPGYVTRMLWDLTRIAAVKSAIAGYSEVVEDYIYEAVKLAPLQAMGYSKGQLTMREMEVYSYIVSNPEGVTPQQIKEETEIPEKTIMEALKKLKSLKLVDKVEAGKKTIYYPKGVM